MSDAKKSNGHRVYILRIEYNHRTSKIIDMTEEFKETEPSFYYGDVILEDYWDEEALGLMYEMNDIGVS